MQVFESESVFLVHYLIFFPSIIRSLPTVNYLDRYLSVSIVTEQKMVHSALVCLFIASKFHDVYPVVLEDLMAVAGKFRYQSKASGNAYSYSMQHYLKLEVDIVNTLRFDFNVVTSLKLAHYLSLAPCESDAIPLDVVNWMKTALHIALVDHKYMTYLPSQVAIAAIRAASYYSASFVFNKWAIRASSLGKQWGLPFYSDDINQCTEDLKRALIKALPHIGDNKNICDSPNSVTCMQLY